LGPLSLIITMAITTTSDDFDIVNWAISEYDIKGAGLALRFGDTNYSGAGMRHLHFHLICPSLDDNDLSIPVYFPFE